MFKYYRDRYSRSSWSITSVHVCSLKRLLIIALKLEPINGYFSQQQRMPVLSLADQNLSVMSFTDRAMYFSITENKVNSIISFVLLPNSSPSQAGHYFLILYFQSPPFLFGNNTGHCISQLQAVPSQLLTFPIFAC